MVQIKAFANDMAIISRNQNVLYAAFQELKLAAAQLELEINKKKQNTNVLSRRIIHKIYWVPRNALSLIQVPGGQLSHSQTNEYQEICVSLIASIWCYAGLVEVLKK